MCVYGEGGSDGEKRETGRRREGSIKRGRERERETKAEIEEGKERD